MRSLLAGENVPPTSNRLPSAAGAGARADGHQQGEDEHDKGECKCPALPVERWKPGEPFHGKLELQSACLR